MRRPLLAAVLLASLAACEAAEPADPPATEATDTGAAPTTPSPDTTASPTPGPGEANDATCGADRLGRWLNVLPTETVMAEIAAAVGERPIRSYTQGDPITMDFNAARLNVELGADGRIKLFRCG